MKADAPSLWISRNSDLAHDTGILGGIPIATPQIKQLARRAYSRFSQNPKHPSLRFKPIQGIDAYGVRIGAGYRALGYMPGSNVIVWFWIGSHADYNNMIP